jgi:hypothetical protein
MPEFKIPYVDEEGNRQVLGTALPEAPVNPGEKKSYLNERGEVAFWDPSTNTEKWIQHSFANKAAEQGLIPLTFEELTAKQHEKSLDSPWEAFAGSAVSQATMGASDLIANVAGADDYLQRREDLRNRNPIASLAGDITGTVASSIAGPIGLIGKVGAKAAKSIAGKIIARGAAEGGATAIAADIANQSIANQFDVEGAAKRVAAGMALGGGLSVAGIGLSKVAGKVKSSLYKRAGVDEGRFLKLIEQEKKLVEEMATPSAIAEEVREQALKKMAAAHGKYTSNVDKINALNTAKNKLVQGFEIPKISPQAADEASALTAKLKEQILKQEKGAVVLHKNREAFIEKINLLKTQESKEAAAKYLSSLTDSINATQQKITSLRAAEQKISNELINRAKKEALLEIDNNLLRITDESKALKGTMDKIGNDVLGPSMSQGVKEIKQNLLNEVRREISQNRKELFKATSRAVSFFRGGPLFAGVLGGISAGSLSGIFLGIAGYAAGKALMSPTAIGIYSKVGPKVGRAVGKFKQPAKFGLIKMISDAQFEAAREEIKFVDPEIIRQDALEGYMAGGMNKLDAEEMANIEATRVAVAKDALEGNDRFKASKILNALEDPRRILERLKNVTATKEDIFVLKKVFPKVYRQIVINAEYHLKKEKNLSPETKRQLEMIVGNESKISRVIQEVFMATEESPDPRGKTYNAATNMQRIAKGY